MRIKESFHRKLYGTCFGPGELDLGTKNFRNLIFSIQQSGQIDSDARFTATLYVSVNSRELVGQ